MGNVVIKRYYLGVFTQKLIIFEISEKDMNLSIVKDFKLVEILKDNRYSITHTTELIFAE